MKKLALWSLICSSIFVNAQTPVYDSVSLGANYVKMSFYSLADGEAANVNAKDWDLQFGTDLMGAAIRVNDGAGVMLYKPQYPDTTGWVTLDTAGMTPLYNADTSWSVGAFNILALGPIGPGLYDFGWGVYNQTSHRTTGTKVFVIRTINGNYKKIWIDSLASDGLTYRIKIRNLDNSGDTLITLRKSDYPARTSFYYAIDAGEEKNIEPAQNNWDLVFRRYVTFLDPPGIYYTVSGPLSNAGVTVAEARGVPVSTTDYSGLTFESSISTIGWDWKTPTPTPEIVDSLVYFVSALDANIYKLVFTGFDGPTGKISFTKTQLTNSTGVSDLSNIQAVAVYPNPSTDNVQALFTLQKEADVTINVLDLSGKSHLTARTQTHTGLNVITLNTEGLTQGFYLLSVDDGSNIRTYKFVRN